MRATRLGIENENVELVADENVDALVALAEKSRPDLVVVDSIQTVGVPEITSAPGGVAQVRESAARLIRWPRRRVPPWFWSAMSPKRGAAGPKILEHMVDVVLYLEGDPDRGFRVLRSNKNRFG